MSTEELEGKLNAVSTVLVRLIELLPISQAQRLADELKIEVLEVERGTSMSISKAAKEAHLRELGVFKCAAEEVAKGK